MTISDMYSGGVSLWRGPSSTRKMTNKGCHTHGIFFDQGVVTLSGSIGLRSSRITSVAFDLKPKAFEALVDAMLEADAEATLKAFGKALSKIQVTK